MEAVNKPLEFARDAAEAAIGAGKFLVSRLVGGGWSELPHGEPGPVRRPVRANITFISTSEEEAADASH